MFVDYALKRDSSVDDEIKKILGLYDKTLTETRIIQNEKEKEAREWTENLHGSVSIKSSDNLKLMGKLYVNNSHSFVILLHGFHSSHESMNPYAYKYYQNGFNVLNIDQRAHGLSEGEYITMGCKEQEDLMDWIEYIINIDADADIILHGVSMGAATVMMTVKNSLPSNVKVVIEDCGYTSLWETYSNTIRYDYKHVPVLPILFAASLVARIRTGFWIHKVSPMEALKKNETPILFIHGTCDNYIPYESMLKLYEANAGEKKEKLSVIGAKHARSIYTDYDEYWETIFNFIEKYI